MTNIQNPPSSQEPRIRLDFAKIEKALHPAHITPTWMWSPSYDGDIQQKLPSILPELPHLFSNYDVNDGLPKGETVIRWLDAANGVEGIGLIALVAHVLGIPTEEAAWRCAMAASLVEKKPFSFFLKKDVA